MLMSDDSDNMDDAGDKAELLALLEKLKAEHRVLDSEITAARETGAVDMLLVGRMKKLKLRLKDKIALVEDKLMPNIIA